VWREIVKVLGERGASTIREIDRSLLRWGPEEGGGHSTGNGEEKKPKERDKTRRNHGASGEEGR